MTLLHAVPDNEIYSGLSPQLRMLALKGEQKTYPKKALLINEGDTGDELFVLLRGSVKVFSANRSRREITYAKVFAGDYVGELSLDGGPRSASVMALEACTCAVVPRSSVSAHLLAHPAFALDLVVQVIRRARAITDVARNMALRGVYSRLAEALELDVAAAAAANPSKGPGMYPVTLYPLTHQELAGRVGASREMISRLLKDLEKGGYLEMSARRLVILGKLPSGW